jgi:galactonate dehydratase
MRFAVDGLWHLPPDRAVAMGRDLDARNARWLECPLYPEEVEAHVALAAAIRTPLALGESYRSLRELQPFLSSVGVLQPDLGRCGITGSLRIAAAFSGEIVPHLSIAMGPQIAAALHFAAAAQNCSLCEFNPHVFDSANSFLQTPLTRKGGEYHVSQAPGLGIEWNARFDANFA